MGGMSGRDCSKSFEFVHQTSTQFAQGEIENPPNGDNMLRASIIIAALACTAGTGLAQNRFELAQASGAFVVVKPSGKPFATAPVKVASPSDRPVAARRAPSFGGAAFTPEDTDQQAPATADAPQPAPAPAQTQQRTAQAQPQNAQGQQRQGQRAAPAADADADPDKEQETGDKEPDDGANGDAGNTGNNAPAEN